MNLFTRFESFCKIFVKKQLLLSVFSLKILCSDGCHAMVSNNKSNIKIDFLENLQKCNYVGKNVGDCQLPDVLIQLVLLNIK